MAGIRTKRLSLLLAGAAAVAVAASVASQWRGSPPDDAPVARAAPPVIESGVVAVGRAKLSLALPAGSALTTVAYAVESSRHVVVARGSIAIKDPSTTAVSQEITLPAGSGNTVTFVGSSNASGAVHTAYLGRRTFDVAGDRTAEVSLVVPAGAGEGRAGAAPSEGSIAGALTANTNAPADSAEACRSCQLSSGEGICDPPNITATSSTNPQTGEQTGIGWGCSTLADAKAQAACLALLRCLNTNACGRKGENPIMGCYCGAASADACLAGNGITGACIAEYHAAAAASGDPQVAGATVAQLSRVIATWASDPTTPVGLADNIKHCANDTHCDACEAL